MRNLLEELTYKERDEIRFVLNEAYLETHKDAFRKHQHKWVAGGIKPTDRISIQKRCFSCGHKQKLKATDMEVDGSFQCNNCDKVVKGSKEGVMVEVTKNFQVVM